LPTGARPVDQHAVDGAKSYTVLHLPEVTMIISSLKARLGAISIVSAVLCGAAAPATAGDYYVVVAVKGRIARGEAPISVVLNSSTLPPAAVGVPYSADLKPLVVVQGDPAYTGAGLSWSAVDGSLPAGLSLTGDGTLTGTPTAAGAGSVTARVTYKDKSTEQSYPLTIEGPPDPYWQSVVLLASPEIGVYRDMSKYAATLTPGAGVSIDSSVARFPGTSSMKFTSSSAGVSVPYSAAKFDMTNTNKTWTVEAWVYLQNPQASIQLYRLDVLGNAASSSGWEATITSSQMGVVYPGYGGPTPGKAIAAGQWHHMAWQRNNTNYSFAVDGVVATTATYTGGLTAGNSMKIGGNYNNSVGITYNIQDLRVTNGVLRYPTTPGATYNVPSEPLPRK
jgi:hypothetical protein